jgi:hypothetical protein
MKKPHIVDIIFNFVSPIFNGPDSWSKKSRRIFLLTLPISFPLMLIGMVGAAIIVFVTAITFGIYGAIIDSYNDFVQWVKKTWNKEDEVHMSTYLQKIKKLLDLQNSNASDREIDELLDSMDGMYFDLDKNQQKEVDAFFIEYHNKLKQE